MRTGREEVVGGERVRKRVFGVGKEFGKVTGLFKTAAENVLDRDVRTQRRELRYLSLAPDKQQRAAAVCRLSR